MIKRQGLFWVAVIFINTCFSQTGYSDQLVFGNPTSEAQHAVTENSTKIIKGALDESARVLLPIRSERVEGGNISFTMNVDPEKQNYCTVRFWGGDTGDKDLLILFCEGKQIGYRHLGDLDMLNIANAEAPFPGRFIYNTLPLPLAMTKGKTKIQLSIHSTGEIARYANTFDGYQKPMTEPTKALYKAYTHTDKFLVLPTDEKQGTEPAAKKRSYPGEEIIKQVKNRVNDDIAKMLKKPIPNQTEIWILSDAYQKEWTLAYKNSIVIDQTRALADDYCSKFEGGSTDMYRDSWVTIGPLCHAIRLFYPQLKKSLGEKMDNGKTRGENWSALLSTCLNYAKTHRRQYTNQCMIVDLHLYNVNAALAMIDPSKALPTEQTLNYMYQAVGLIPWVGSETLNGPEKPLGDNYYQLTDKGLTKELGFVGGYGEVLNWAVLLYEATGELGNPSTRDTLLRKQLMKIMKARSYFRYPALDNDGNTALRAETVVSWRDHDSYPGEVTYGEKGSTRESTPLMTSTATLDPVAVAYAQQMMDDKQLFSVIKDKLNDKTQSNTQVLMRIPDEYALIKKQPRFQGKLPMTTGSQDFVFSDEEDGVVAIKNGDEILYTSLYWRANFAINSLARVHYITPNIERIATVYEDVKYTPSGYTYKRPERVNMFFTDARNFYPDVKSANTGEELPIAKIPDGVRYKPGDESVFAGKGDFYKMRYGKYLIGMNCSKDKEFELTIPAGIKKVIDLTDNKRVIKEEKLQVKPRSTIVLELVD
jgi:hypothetical protein